jgi:hypothetical protein
VTVVVLISGVVYGNSLFDSSFDFGTCRHGAHLALQQELGLLSDWRPGSHPYAHDRIIVPEPNLKAGCGQDF